MSISKLTRIIESYDKYGMHRVNGIKVVYILFILFLFNMLFCIPRVYFYYFYIPITAMTAEVFFENIRDKYTAFIYTILGSCLMVFLFNVLRSHPSLFLFASFVGAISLYLIAINWAKIMIPLVPIILSLATYSLLYPHFNANLNMIINNLITTLFALLIILAALILFPLTYYYRLWLRAFIFLLQDIRDNLVLIQNCQSVKLSLIHGNTKHIVTFARMLPRKLPVFTILKINLLANQFYLGSCVTHSDFTEMKQEKLRSIIEHLSLLICSIKKERACKVINTKYPLLTKLILAWNNLCLRQ